MVKKSHFLIPRSWNRLNTKREREGGGISFSQPSFLSTCQSGGNLGQVISTPGTPILNGNWVARKIIQRYSKVERAKRMQFASN